MNHRKLLALVLTLCLILGTLSPAASAVSIGSADRVSTSGKGESSGSSGNGNLIESIAKKLGLTLPNNEEKLSYSDGQWLVTSADGTVSVAKDSQLPEYVQTLRELAEHYEATDFVEAFVVLEDAPTAERYDSAALVPQSTTATLTAKQDSLVDRIECDVLGGKSLEILTRFTYLTNSLVIKTEFANLEAIAALDGVKSVFISPEFYPCQTEGELLTPSTESSGEMSGIPAAWALGYTGKGRTIAILDTGLDLDHPSFAAAPEGAAWTKEMVQEMLDTYDLNAERLFKRGTLTADKIYYSEKVPFIFNYASGTTNVQHGDGLGDHGTHVAGIAAANNVEGSGVVGMAPDAQIIVMKVFNSSTGASSMYDLVEALEDCMTLGVDVVNMSLGSAAGFASSNDEEIDAIFRRISESDIIVDVAAGNDGHSMYGSLYGNSANLTDYIDTATVASPSTYLNSMSIASANNAKVYWDYFSLADGTKVHYMQPVEYLYEYVSYSFEILKGKELEYVIIDGVGEYEDFLGADGKSLVEGKVAVIKRGNIQFSEKALNAQDAGAVGVLIWDNVEEYIFNFGMTMTFTDPDTGEEYYPEIPAVLISKADGQKLADAQKKLLYPTDKLAPRDDITGGQMSSFSGWGVAPDLRLLPDLTGVGGNVYSCYDGGEYGLMSGTSMATPQVAGVSAVVLQYVKENYPDATEAEIRAMVDGLMMSTAEPVIDSSTNVPASPRQQGAGLVNGYSAITAKAYLSVAGTTRSKVEMGDNAEGKFRFTFTVNNLSDSEKTYKLSSFLLCEDYKTDDDYPGKYFIAASEHELDNSAVKFSADSVTVPANGKVELTVTIELTEADKLWIDTYFPAGNYVEGFIYLTPENEDDVILSLPFLGFYQDWQESPVFDTGFWFDNGFWGYDTDTVEANQYYHSLFTNLGSSSTDWVLGFNPYSNPTFDENGKVEYDPKNNVLSPNGDGVLDNISNYYLSLLRNVKWLRLTYTDENGKVLDCEVLDYISKTMYNSSYGSTVPFVYSWEYNSLYDFTDENGEYLPDGTKVTLTISAVLAYDDNTDGSLENAESDDVMMEIPIYIDTVAPAISGTPIEFTKDGHNYMTLTIKDEHPATAVLMNKTGSMMYHRYSDADMTRNADGTYSVTLDITGLGDDFTVALCDYGCNEAYYSLHWSQSGTNNPVVDTDALYAYRIYDLYTGYYYGYDYMYGWGTLDKSTGAYTEQRSDASEQYAIVAAEYAGGYVFGVDANYNFVWMQPGLWNRNWICNLGINVLDMAFDDATGTMYLTTKGTTKEYDDYWGEWNTVEVYRLCTIDLLTGALTTVAEYSGEYSMPWTMTFIDGTLYAVKKYYEGIWTVDTKTGELTQVLDGDGNKICFYDSYGNKLQAGYSQSMTYSKADGKIYWAYYNTNGASFGLVAIDPTNWSYDFSAFEYQQEFVGLLTIEKTDYQLPTSEKATGIQIDTESMVLVPGTSQTINASVLPWNFELTDEIEWTSSEESVATVVDGKVTAHKSGKTTITARYGDFEAACEVLVVDVNGTMYGFNSYSSNGTSMNWFSMDVSSATTKILGYTDVELIAGDYNGHTGCYYGYDSAGQCYRFEEDGTVTALGRPTGKLVADMAYDYLNGYMFAIVYDYGMGSTDFCLVDMRTGALTTYATYYGALFITLACDMYGAMYAIDSAGTLYYITIYDDPNGGVDWGPLSTQSVSASDRYVEAMPLLETGFELAYQQTMCYDHNNDVILWSCCDPSYAGIYWIDLMSSDEPFLIDLGMPDGLSEYQYYGSFILPEEIPELPIVPVEEIIAEDIGMVEGTSVLPSITIEPLNASIRDITYVSDNESIVKVEDGYLLAEGVGTTSVTVTITDAEEHIYTETFNVSVKAVRENLYGFLNSDFLTGDGAYWIGMSTANPTDYEGLSFIADDDGYNYQLYSAEYLDGKIYAYGYRSDSADADWFFLTINPKSWQVTDYVELGSSFAMFVYDLAFDYSSGTMYALAAPSGDMPSDLYYVDLTTGSLIRACTVGEADAFGLAIDEKGQIYVMVGSESDTAKLYSVDVENDKMTLVLDTGVRSNIIATMAYDYDHGYIYWNSCYRLDFFSPVESSLYLIDLADETITDLGMVGAAGAQVCCLMAIAEEYPSIIDTLYDVKLVNELVELTLGETTYADIMIQPYNLDTKVAWKSENPDVVTVDEDGQLTSVGAGKATVSVTVTAGEQSITKTLTVLVYGSDDYLIAYNSSKMGFAAISRTDPTRYTMLTGGEKVGVAAMEILNGVIYAYDEEGNFFTTGAFKDYERSVLGAHGVQISEDEEDCNFWFDIRDMAWDAKNERMLVLGVEMGHQSYHFGDMDYGYDFCVGGCKIYQVNMSTGKLIELVGVYDSMYETVDYGAVSLSVDGEGNVYVISYIDSCLSTVNPVSGVKTNVIDFRTIGADTASGAGNAMAVAYDREYNALYVSYAELEECYELYRYDLNTEKLARVGYMGDAEVGSWYTTTDSFAGLVANEEHICHETILINVREVTCTEDGYTGDYYCAEGDHIAVYGEVVEHEGHKFDDEVIEPTCEKVGYTIHTCTVCGHSCVDTFVDATGHDYESKITKQPTCTEEGEITFTCKNGDCGKSYTQVLPKAEHELTVITIDPTCEEFGYTEYKCKHCDYSRISSITQPTGHKHTEVIGHKDATCCDDGYTGDVYCKDCEKTIEKGSIIPATGHEFGEWTIEKEASCFHDGELRRYCANCDTFECKAIPAGSNDCPSDKFTDVNTGLWYHEAIDYVVKLGLMQGNGSGIFAPSADMTRAEFVQVLYRLLGEKVEDAENPFTDVSESFWGYEAIVWAYRAGLIQGRGDGIFDPNGKISREELITVIFRACRGVAIEEDCLSDFSDADRISDYAKDAMNWAVSCGIIEGCNGKLNPRDAASRAEVATVFFRILVDE